ncbi:hypothetical protein MAR_008086, partial [Mya arenaria]
MNISKEEIEHGERALILLYTDRQIDSINDLRVRFFIENVSINSLSNDLSTLPPTSSATKYHSLRTYSQIGLLVPKLTDMAPAPATILQVIRFTYKTGCRSMACGR